VREWVRGRGSVRSRAVGFAARGWDAEVPNPSAWRAVRRVLRPGAHLAVFGCASTLDLLAISMRLGGLEIVDQLVWLHGQGWPRPHPVSLAADDDVAASLKPAATPYPRPLPPSDAAAVSAGWPRAAASPQGSRAARCGDRDVKALVWDGCLEFGGQDASLICASKPRARPALFAGRVSPGVVVVAGGSEDRSVIRFVTSEGRRLIPPGVGGCAQRLRS
jgi:hypothetical protein